MRPYRPGAPRILLSILGVIVFMIPMYSAIIILLAPGLPLVPRLLVVGSFALVATGIGVLVARFFAAGVYVNDDGLRLVTLRGMRSMPWGEVADISSAEARTPILGVPFARTPGQLVVVTLRDTGPVRTTMTSTGLDFVGRPEAYDAAALTVERWWRDAGSDARG
jgi:Bacterial PH domain